MSHGKLSAGTSNPRYTTVFPLAPDFSQGRRKPNVNSRTVSTVYCYAVPPGLSCLFESPCLQICRLSEAIFGDDAATAGMPTRFTVLLKAL